MEDVFGLEGQSQFPSGSPDNESTDFSNMPLPTTELLLVWPLSQKRFVVEPVATKLLEALASNAFF